MQLQRAQQILDNFEGKRILVVGDVMLDEYVWGKVSRISPEAPVMVIEADQTTSVPGGAANVVNNLCALGAKTAIAGLRGADSAGTTLAEKLAEEGADITGLVTAADRPTTLKTRVIARSQHDNMQQIVRVDHERRDPIDARSQAQALAFLEEAIPHCDALLLSDYQKGFLSERIVAGAVELGRRHGKIITGNLKPSSIGAHCRLTILTLNLAEASAASGCVLAEHGGEEALFNAGRVVLQKSGADYVLITRGGEGMTLFAQGSDPVTVPAHPVEVFDGAGAGDTVISTMTLALAAGATTVEAVLLANYAGAVVVKKVGVATVTRVEILGTVEAHARP